MLKNNRLLGSFKNNFSHRGEFVRDQTNPIAIDLFSGAGGLTVGLKQAGFNVLAGVEFDSTAAKTYRLNHGHAVYENDIRKLDPHKILVDLGLKPGELDLLAGCPPCQGFSTLGTRNKGSTKNDERNELVFEFARFVETMRPKTIMMENVPRLASDWRAQKLKELLSDWGYLITDSSIQIKDVAKYGGPQRRKRMILVATRLAGEITNPTQNISSTVRAAIGALPLPGHSGDELHDYHENRTAKTKELIALVPHDGGSRHDLPKEYWLPCHLRYPNGYKDVYGRMKWDTVSPTITGGCTNPSKGRFLHPEQNRAITLREASLLQTFPPEYKFPLDRGKDRVALMIGNALPPAFIKLHAVEIFKHLRMQ